MLANSEHYRSVRRKATRMACHRVIRFLRFADEIECPNSRGTVSVADAWWGCRRCSLGPRCRGEGDQPAPVRGFGREPPSMV